MTPRGVGAGPGAVRAGGPGAAHSAGSPRCPAGPAPRRGAARSMTLAAALLPAVAALLAGCAGDQQIERPTPLQGNAPIEYPLAMWDQDVEGETLLRVLVSETGAVKKVEVMQSSGHAELDSAAVAGARDLRFRPAIRGDRRIEVWATVPVTFSKASKGGGGGAPDAPTVRF